MKEVKWLLLVLIYVPAVVAWHCSSRQCTLPRQKTKLAALFEGIELKSPFATFFATPSQRTRSNAEIFFNALTKDRIDEAIAVLDDDIVYIDTEFPSAFEGKSKAERILRLSTDLASERVVIDDVAYDVKSNKVGINFHMESLASGEQGRIGNACFQLGIDNLITSAFISKESSKSGEANLRILKGASKIISLGKEQPIEKNAYGDAGSLSLPEQYFQAWNDRDIDAACSVFAEDVEYDDTAFPAPFVGKEKLDAHLRTCVECFPSTMSFIVDETIDGKENLMVRWHAENNGDELPFTRGCSFYKIKNGKIVKGVDVVEPAVFKTGGISLLSKSVVSEPIRLLPMVVWVTYMYVVFFSDWFFGLPATALEQRTWEEVRDLSLNFFFVSPVLNLPFAPVVHPMMEGVFNFLLSWAAMFAGFLSDERKDKPNVLPMLPIVVGMQFLTSAFLLPFLATRSEEKRDGSVSVGDLPEVAQATESPILGLSMGGVGIAAIFWGRFARFDDFGDMSERYTSFLQLLSIDRVGSSFLVDLVIFGLFQGWLVDDDLKRRNMVRDSMVGKVAKYIPFFGLSAYLTFRRPLSQNME